MGEAMRPGTLPSATIARMREATGTLGLARKDCRPAWRRLVLACWCGSKSGSGITGKRGPPRGPRWVCSAMVATTAPKMPARSEEHTSELQSQSNLVCRLLLEKKKKEQEHKRNVELA